MIAQHMQNSQSEVFIEQLCIRRGLNFLSIGSYNAMLITQNFSELNPSMSVPRIHRILFFQIIISYGLRIRYKSDVHVILSLRQHKHIADSSLCRVWKCSIHPQPSSLMSQAGTLGARKLARKGPFHRRGHHAPSRKNWITPAWEPPHATSPPST